MGSFKCAYCGKENHRRPNCSHCGLTEQRAIEKYREENPFNKTDIVKWTEDGEDYYGEIVGHETRKDFNYYKYEIKVIFAMKNNKLTWVRRTKSQFNKIVSVGIVEKVLD